MTNYYQNLDGRVFKMDNADYMGEGWSKLSQKAGKEARTKYCIKELKKYIKSGDDIWLNVTHVSSSGMSRNISVFVIKKNKPQNLSFLVGDALQWTTIDNSSVRVGGCGMDMGFHLVYNLGSVLWPKGTRKPHGSRNGEPDRSGGYALKQRYL